MKQLLTVILVSGALLLTAIAGNQGLVPGSRIQVLAHNAYPDHGKYGDRLDRAISAGVPFVVEEDLSWVDGHSVLIHGAKNVGGDDPTLESYFFPKVKPIMEKAMKDGNKGNWPLITLYLDIKNDPVEHLEAISTVLDKYNAWLTTAVKTSDIAQVSPLDLRPMMVLVEDKENDSNKEDLFYNRIPVGGKIRVFGSATKFNANPNHLPKAEGLAAMPSADIDQLVTKKADNYHRWFGADWAFIEKCGKTSGEWNNAAELRLKKFVDHGHKLGYFVSFYSVNGFTESENQGWTAEFNFGSKDAAMIRWKAAIKAHADFIATDQYEDLAKVIRH
jgi:hypothetical protein